MNDKSTCPIWGTYATDFGSCNLDGRKVDSPRAGGCYLITGTAEAMVGGLGVSAKACLTTWLVKQRRMGNQRPKIDGQIIQDVPHWRPMGAGDRADAVLRYLAKKSNTLGKEISFSILIDKIDYEINECRSVYFELLAASECVDYEEFRFLLAYLQDRQWIVRYGKNNREQQCLLTIPGHARVAELERASPDLSMAFIAMWFDPKMVIAYEQGIAPAVTAAGYEPVRIDRKDHLNKIDDEIITTIKRSRFIVADFTHGEEGARGGVYYEAGFAHGLGIPVIFTCRKDMIAKIHFDTRQYNHILWETPEDLQKSLTVRITAVLGDGPNMQGNYEG